MRNIRVSCCWQFLLPAPSGKLQIESEQEILWRIQHKLVSTLVTFLTRDRLKPDKTQKENLLLCSCETPEKVRTTLCKQFQEFMSENGLKVCRMCACMHVYVQVSKLWRRWSMTYTGAEFGKSCYCAKICRSRTGDKHLLPGRRQNLGSELNEGKTKGNRGKHVFLWSGPVGRQPRKKENTNSYFWAASVWQMARTFQFPMIAFVWCRFVAEPRPPSTHTRAQRSASGHLGLPVAAGTRRALPICSHSEKPGVSSPGFVLWKRTPSEERLVRITKRTEPFFHPQPFLFGGKNLRNCVERWW